MLRHTCEQSVLAYYDGWLEWFPDGDALADAEIDDVLKAWEGLGVNVPWRAPAARAPSPACR